MGKTGVLLINLGTPEGPEPHQVKTYLKEFLMDPLVIDIPFVFRWFLVNQVILRKRPERSSEAYKKIWTDQGSPLLVYTLELARKVQEALGDKAVVVAAMRYAKPSILQGLIQLKNAQVSRVLVLPLYPQYSLAATESSIQECLRVKQSLKMQQNMTFLPPFYDDPLYLDAHRPHLENVKNKKFDKIIFSFHGIPERHIRKTNKMNAPNYRTHCYSTAQGLALRMGLNENDFIVSFQSRLGRTPWIQPYTDILLKKFPKQGIKRIAVFCPSFIADCLETLEEIGIRGKKDFIEAGGEYLHFVPSLNAEVLWVKAVSSMIERAL
jgi:ferrochelatase